MTAISSSCEARVEQLTTAAYTVPTDAPEADGTFAWDSTTLVLPGHTATVHPSGSLLIRPLDSTETPEV